MATPPEKLAESLELLEKLQAAGGAAAIRARDLTRTHRERLMAAGFLQEVIKGWYIPSRPDEVKGESTIWYASFWRFCAAYLDERFGADWCLSPEQSLSLHAGNWTVPRQLMVRSARARNKITKLPHGTSLFDLRAALPVAAEILKTMAAAGYDARENDPFADKPTLVFAARETSPYVNRVRLLWEKMREPIIERFPKAPGLPKNIDAYMKRVDDAYVTDAYHSLSIEGYRVTRDLIERVRAGTWNPEANEGDREQRNAMAARGYWLAYQSVQGSVRRVVEGANAGDVAATDHRNWYRELFAPSVTAGILKPGDLAGYRNGPVYIRKSMHVPLNREAVLDTMPALFDLLRAETEPSVRAVLGHFIFVYIHPYIDGNGRVGRFLMNVMMASGGYPWTVIPVENRTAYMHALEKASVGEDITPFADFVAGLVEKRLAGEPMPAVPKGS